MAAPYSTTDLVTSEIEDLRRKLRAAEERVVLRDNEIKSLTKRTETLTKLNATNARKAASAIEAMMESDNKNIALANELLECTKELGALKAISKNTAELEARLRTFPALEAEREMLKSQLSDNVDEIRSLQSRLNRMAQELSGLKAAQAPIMEDLKHSKLREASYSDQLAKATEAAMDMSHKHMLELRKKEEELTRAIRQMHEFASASVRAEADLANTKATHEKDLATLADLTRQRVTLIEQDKIQKQRIAQLQQEVSDLAARLATETAKNTSLEAQITTLNQSAASSHQLALIAGDRIAAQEAQITDLKAELQRAAEQAAPAMILGEEMQVESATSDLKAQNEQLAETVKTQAERIQQAESQIAALTREPKKPSPGFQRPFAYADLDAPYNTTYKF